MVCAAGLGSLPRLSVRFFPNSAVTPEQQARLANIALMIYFDGMNWVVTFLDDQVQAELDAFPADILARFAHIVSLIKSYGLEKVREPYVKHLEGPLWEMRMRGKDGIARALYVTATGRRVVVVRVFAKKTPKTPRREIELALKRAQEVT